jgi:Family of unknown function (DUF5808)
MGKNGGGRLRSLLKAASWILTGAAVLKEIQQPPERRTWHGTVAGFVPYDFRIPTVERMRAAWWSPDDERVVTETPFGLGWTVNFGRVARLLAR